MLLAETERFPKGPRRSVADVDLDLLRAERLRMGTFDDNRRHHRRRAPSAFRTVEFRLDPPAGDIGLRRAVERFPFVPVRRGAAGAGLLRGLQHPGLRAGAAAARDRAAQGRDRRLRRARLHPRADRRGAGDGPGGPPAQRHPRRSRCPASPPATRTKGNALRLMRGARRHVRGARHHRDRAADADEPRPPVLRGRAGLRRHLRERAGRAAHRLPVPRGQPARRHRAGHRRPLRAGAGLVHLRRRRPDVALQRQRRGAEDADPAPDPLGGRRRSSSTTRSARSSLDVLDTEITPELVPTGEDEEVQSSEAKVGPVLAAGLHAVPRAALRLPAVARSRSWRGTPGTTRSVGDWPPGFPADERPAYTLAEIRHWLEVFAQRFFEFSQFKRSALPNGPKVAAGGSLSPRGDWRAPSDLSARIWLEEMRRSTQSARRVITCDVRPRTARSGGLRVSRFWSSTPDDPGTRTRASREDGQRCLTDSFHAPATADRAHADEVAPPYRSGPAGPGDRQAEADPDPPPARAQGARRALADAHRLRHVHRRDLRRGRDPGAARRRLGGQQRLRLRQHPAR